MPPQKRTSAKKAPAKRSPRKAAPKAPQAPKSLTEAKGKGLLISLETLRDTLATAIDDCESNRDLAALTSRYMEVSERIHELGGGVTHPQKTGLDEFSRKYAEKRNRVAAAKAGGSSS